MNRMYSRNPCFAIALLAAAGLVEAADPGASSASANAGSPDLASLSIEELTQVEVTSAGRKDQKLSQVAAAVFVITADDIRRSGVSSVPELLRMVPGIQVAQIAANIWAVSSRGFNGRGASGMLVMVDGRSIYNSLFSGTFWDQNQVPLERIERIEVIRGPGATMWGANAIDGVISIVTKKAQDVKGTSISAEAGRTNLPDALLQFGDSAGRNIQYSLDTGFGDHPGLLAQTGGGGGDRWNSGHGDFRLDWQAGGRDALSFDGGAYKGGGGESVNVNFPEPSTQGAVEPFNFSGGYFTGNWQHQFASSAIAFEAYYDRENRYETPAHGSLNTTDFDFQHHLHLGSRNDFLWGLGYRYRTDDSADISQHGHFEENLFSLFAQDEIALVPNRLSLTAGTRLEDYRTTTGANFGVEPQARLLWAPSKRQSLWGAVSRVVHSPSQLERDMLFPLDLPPENGLNVAGSLIGNPQAAPEIVMSYEAGYRRQIGRKLTLDLALFVDCRTGTFAFALLPPYLTMTPGPTIVANEQWGNVLSGETQGGELTATWTPARHWRLQASYAREDADLRAEPGSTLPESPMWFWRTPRNTLDIRSGWDITRRWSIDATVYWVSRIPDYPVPDYTRVDLRIARRIGEGGEISAGARNLFDRAHLEFISEDYIVSSLVPRDVYAKVMWRF